MKAIGYSETGPARVLRDLDLTKPIAGPRDLIVRVEAAGVVESVGSEVTLFSPGDAVFYTGDITRPGTNAQFHAVDERLVGPKPQTLGFAEAAALPLTTITAWEILFERLEV